MGMKKEDYLGFMSNLINCLKLGRNTSFDQVPEDLRVKRIDSYSEESKRGIVFIMDNFSIHRAKVVNNIL